MPILHRLPSSPETVHWGFFDAGLRPVLRARSGEKVTFDCVSGGPEHMPRHGLEVLPELAEIHKRVRPHIGPHILTGPVYVEGAMPGDVLEVHIHAVELRQDWGYTLFRPLAGTLPEDFNYARLLHIPIRRRERVAIMPWGMRVPLRPFFGVMGVAPPPEWGAVTSIIPRAFGGNLDNKELIPGTTLYLPVFVEGALFSVGDGHAVQGDGEVSTTALETCLSGTFELTVRKDLKLTMPRAETPTQWITMGLDTDLDDAAKQALREMIVLLGEVAELIPADAYQLCSLACDLRVTQLVDGNKGIHAVIDKSILESAK